jgi:tetratricopeptide (TPR) repeat protein
VEGKDAMAARHRTGGFGQLWQLPLLIASLGLFAYAAFIFIDPKSGPSVDERITAARACIKAERPEAAIDQLNSILATQKLDQSHESTVHLLLGEALADLQSQRHSKLRSYADQILEQTHQALSLGARTSYEVERRLAESYELIGKPGLALDHYRQAMELDPTHALRLQRKVIDLQLAQNDAGAAEASLETYNRTPDLADGERAWALCTQAKLLIDRNEFVKGRTLLERAQKLDPDPTAQGQINYFLGFCAYELGDPAEAERLLRVCRQQLKTEHPLDADAAYLLGVIRQDKPDYAVAASFYQDVLLCHPDSIVATRSLLGRGLCRIQLDQVDAGVTDLTDLTHELLASSAHDADKPQAIAALATSATHLSSTGDFASAIELLDDEQSLEKTPPPSFFGRLSLIYERRADQLQAVVDQTPAEKVRRARQIHELLTKAGDASVAQSRGLTQIDDKGYADALWRGIDMYDRAANLQATAAALELFVAERPTDPLTPTALLRLGRAYLAMGTPVSLDKAISAFQRNQFLFPNSLAASKSAVPLAQAYIAKGPASYPKAEAVLKGVIENNALLSPEAEEFKQSLFELAQLYYRTGRFDESIARLEEMTLRYPNDPRIGQLLFMTADSYRKSAADLETRPAVASTDPAAAGKVAGETAGLSTTRRERLVKAKALFDQVVDLYHQSPPRTELDKLYKKLANFYRADCLFDCGQYEDAIRLYDAAAFQYQDDPSSLAAYVQIVNAYYALGKPDEAKSATERARWLLKRMPPDAFTNGSFSMPREYWENQLKWSAQSGLW